MNDFRAVALSAVTLLFCASPVLAQSDDAGKTCEATSSTEFISIALCPEGMTEEELKVAGTEICDNRLPCGVWFWTNPDDMPEEAPENHDGLTQPQVTSALAVWVGEKGMIIKIEKLEN